MEYLMTYGWAILIISVVLAALWQVGVFNSGSQVPRAQPGSCKVARQTIASGGVQVSLVGVCNRLLPQFVASFDGTTSYINTGTNNFPTGSSPSSFSAWVYVPSYGILIYPIFSYGTPAPSETAVLAADNGYSGLSTFYTGIALDFYGLVSLTPGTWHQVGWVYDGATSITLYVDGVVPSPLGLSHDPETLPQQNIVLGTSTIGVYASGLGTFYWSGLISDVQLYNTTLSASEMQTLYAEGIGGAPLPMPNLVGWWPLNGDTKDYSGNNNDGTPYNIFMNSSWSSVYVQP